MFQSSPNNSFHNTTNSVTTIKSDNSSPFNSQIGSLRRHSLKPCAEIAEQLVVGGLATDPISNTLKAHLEQVDMAGYLNVRKRQSMSKNWKRRWFMLKDHQLVCYLAGPATEVVGAFHLSNYSRISHEPECRKSTLCMVLYSDHAEVEPLYLYAATAVEYKSWFFCIDRCLQEKSVNIIDRVMERLNSTKFTDFYHEGSERDSMSIESSRFSHDFRLEPAPATTRKLTGGSFTTWSNSSHTIFHPLGFTTRHQTDIVGEKDDSDAASITSRKSSIKSKLSELPHRLSNKFNLKNF